jgi:hypothetical protein
MGAGIANIKNMGAAKLQVNSGNWMDVIRTLPSSENENIAELVAEWADADAVAASIAHDVEYFCTHDVAKGSSNKGVVSVMSAAKSQAITTAFGIKFVSPTDLCAELVL